MVGLRGPDGGGGTTLVTGDAVVGEIFRYWALYFLNCFALASNLDVHWAFCALHERRWSWCSCLVLWERFLLRLLSD